MQHYNSHGGPQDDRETEDINIAGVEAGRYEKDPDLDLSMVGADPVLPNRDL
jgi:hypothetical protein